MIHTNHLGDSGMKNNPGIKTVQGKIPATEHNFFIVNILDPETK